VGAMVRRKRGRAKGDCSTPVPERRKALQVKWRGIGS
jgi:hypothetical protein